MVFRVFSQDRIQQRTVEQTIPATSLAEMIVEVPVIQTQGRTQQGVNTHVQHVVNTVEVERPKIAVIPDIRTVPGPQNSESLSVDSRGLNHQDYEVLFHVNKQSPDIARGVHVERDVLHAGNGARTAAAAAQRRSTQQRKQWQQPRKEDEEEKGREEREKGRKGQRGSGQEGRKEEEKEAEDGGGEQFENDVTGWTEVTRKKRRKTVQIFVKVDEAKVTPMDVSLTDGKVEDVVRQVQKDEDVYVTMHGRVLRRNEKLKSCGVTDGCTIQVTSRMRGGGKHKDKKGQKERKRATKPKGPEQKSEEEPKRDRGPAIQECDRDTVVQMIEESEENRKVMVRMLEENEDNRKMIESISEGSDFEVEQAFQNFRTAGREVLGWDQGQADLVERGLRWAVEARRKGRRQQEEEQQRQGEQGQHPGQEQSKQGKQVRFRDEEQLEEKRAETAGEPEVMGRTTEVRTGRGSTGLVRGGDERCRADETNRKGKGKGNGGKGEHEGKGGGFGHKGNHPETREREEERVRMAPNMGAGGSHPQAMSDPEEGEMAAGGQQCNEEKEEINQEEVKEESGEEKKETRGMRWADCEDDEGKEKEEQETKELTSETPPGLERKEESKQEAQEAREEERRAQEAREEERRAQEERENGVKAQEEQKKEVSAQGE